MPLKVIIVGAGIGGICAALALRKAGHDVEVGFLASSSSLSPANCNFHQYTLLSDREGEVLTLSGSLAIQFYGS